MNGFDDFDTEVQCEEVYGVEDALIVDSYEVQLARYNNVEEVYQEDAISYDDSYDDHFAMYDNDPSPYDGTYSEE